MKEIPEFLRGAHEQYEALLTPKALSEIFALDDLAHFADFYRRHAPLAKARFLSPGQPLHTRLHAMGYASDEQKLTYFLTSFYAAMRLKYDRENRISS